MIIKIWRPKFEDGDHLRRLRIHLETLIQLIRAN